MGAAAGIFGGIGGLCAVMGIVTAARPGTIILRSFPAGIIPPVMPEFTWMFWLVLSAVLLLASIAFALGRSSGYD